MLAITAVLVPGCASVPFAVTFDSNPQGAVLVCNGERWGYTPETFYFPKDEVSKGNGLNLDYCSAVWFSNAQTKYGNIPPDADSGGARITAQRPDAPGLEEDMNFAFKVQQIKSQQTEINAGPRRMGRVQQNPS